MRRKVLIAGNYTKYALEQTSNLFVMNWFVHIILYIPYTQMPGDEW